MTVDIASMSIVELRELLSTETVEKAGVLLLQSLEGLSQREAMFKVADLYQGTGSQLVAIGDDSFLQIVSGHHLMYVEENGVWSAAPASI